MFTVSRSVQFENAPELFDPVAIEVIVSGSVTSFNFAHLVNAFDGIEVNPVKYFNSLNMVMSELPLKIDPKLVTLPASSYDIFPSLSLSHITFALKLKS